MDPGTRRNLWVVAAVIVVVALVLHHNITSTDVILFCVIVPSIILHEISHGWVAFAFGDDTAKRAGRLTLNPARHVDPVGTLIVPALLALGSFAMIGWAKPVPVNTARLRSPRNEGVLVSLAGPLTNIVLAAIGAVLFVTFFRTSFIETYSVTSRIFLYFSVVNVGLAAFNLIPIPPLDGSAVFERMLPARHWPTYLRYRQYTMPLVLGLVILNFYLGSHGPLTWAFNQLYSWWGGVLGV